VTINYSVTVNSPGAGTPTGTVTVSDGSQSCTGTVAAGTCSITFVTPGSKTLTATYAGDTNFNGSTSAGEPHQVVNQWTLHYLTPIDESTVAPPHLVVNEGKNGRVIPVKITLTLGGVQQTNTQIADGRLTIRVNAASCDASIPTDPVETYADAGASNGNTDVFRYSSGSWIYNLDTKALGLVTGSCYRLDVYLDSIRISTQTYAIFKPVK
jgi:hypothetical protein